MSDDHLSRLWAFSRGDLAGPEFEKWLFDQVALEELLGEDLLWNLLAGNYADREEVWQLRKSLGLSLGPMRRCECPAIRDVAAVPMGGDFYFEKVFESLERLIDYGPDKWWLYISRCSRCGTVWLIAQDDRIYDEFFLLRIDEPTLAEARTGRWPQKFASYEDVIATGRQLSNPPRFLDPMAHSLQWTVEDLLKERPAISSEEVGYLLGISASHASQLLRKVRRPRIKWPFRIGRNGH